LTDIDRSESTASSRWVLLLVVCAQFMITIDVSIANVALSLLRRARLGDLIGTSRVVDCGETMARLPGDRYDRRPPSAHGYGSP
jgi:hypothetical protein